MFRRPPDIVIGTPSDPYMHRWYVIPRNRWFNVYLHKFLRNDDDRALHDHPWWSLSLALKGQYFELVREKVLGVSVDVTRLRDRFSFVLRSAEHAHRIILPRGPDGKPIPAWTIFLTGPKIREWGFHCPGGWRGWREFTTGPNGEAVGKGCD